MCHTRSSDPQRPKDWTSSGKPLRILDAPYQPVRQEDLLLPLGPDRGAVNPEMINAPMWLAKAKTMLVANGFRRSKDAARAGRSSRAAPNSLRTRIRDGTIGKTMPAALG